MNVEPDELSLVAYLIAKGVEYLVKDLAMRAAPTVEFHDDGIIYSQDLFREPIGVDLGYPHNANS